MRKLSESLILANSVSFDFISHTDVSFVKSCTENNDLMRSSLVTCTHMPSPGGKIKVKSFTKMGLQE